MTAHRAAHLTVLVAGLTVAALASVASATPIATPQAAAPTSKSAQPNTWSAATSTGRTFMGTWTYAEDPATGTVSGAWTLTDAQGRTLARGGWSAAKSPTGWTGGWRAAASGNSAEYAGTWSTSVPLNTGAPFTDLFQAAAQAVISGTWRAGPQFGAWSIRASQ